MPITARCGRAEEIPPGGSKVVQINEHVVAIFNMGGAFYALDNTCPHQGGPLGEGYLEETGVISCPWHGWTFDLKTGISPIDPDVSVRRYPIRIEAGEIIVEIG
ncbi:MAG TPA: Rieske (2Fe-2S) protein [Candidatus Polarisedimenticolia bacterium]|nr:Rieske (2Fe-2S) protein [Candidatus Polarisedimenticolia bacterium]